MEGFGHFDGIQSLITEDDYFISSYGEELAGLLKYEAHSATSPLDDAMRCTSVLTHANGNHVHIAVARPQAIYVLYPHQGEQLLCRGAVFPYFEFTDNEIVDDQSWKKRIGLINWRDRLRHFMFRQQSRPDQGAERRSSGNREPKTAGTALRSVRPTTLNLLTASSVHPLTNLIRPVDRDRLKPKHQRRTLPGDRK